MAAELTFIPSFFPVLLNLQLRGLNGLAQAFAWRSRVAHRDRAKTRNCIRRNSLLLNWRDTMETEGFTAK
jgi:hypothetical protein